MQRLIRHQQLRLISELSITPMLSLVVVLLLVFMVASPLIRGSSAGVQGGVSTPANVAKLTVDKRQSLWLEGRSIETADLSKALVSLVEKKPGVGVVVQIDSSVPVEALIRIMDSLRQAGVQKTAVKALDK